MYIRTVCVSTHYDVYYYKIKGFFLQDTRVVLLSCRVYYRVCFSNIIFIFVRKKKTSSLLRAVCISRLYYTKLSCCWLCVNWSLREIQIMRFMSLAFSIVHRGVEFFKGFPHISTTTSQLHTPHKSSRQTSLPLFFSCIFSVKF